MDQILLEIYKKSIQKLFQKSKKSPKRRFLF